MCMHTDFLSHFGSTRLSHTSRLRAAHIYAALCKLCSELPSHIHTTHSNLWPATHARYSAMGISSTCAHGTALTTSPPSGFLPHHMGSGRDAQLLSSENCNAFPVTYGKIQVTRITSPTPSASAESSLVFWNISDRNWCDSWSVESRSGRQNPAPTRNAFWFVFFFLILFFETVIGYNNWLKEKK